MRKASEATRVGVIHYGSTAAAMDEACDLLQADRLHVDALRLRAFPFGAEVEAFVATHDRIFVVEQNRDAQMRTLLAADFPLEAGKFVSILHYDGSPITARFIRREIAARMRTKTAARLQEAIS